MMSEPASPQETATTPGSADDGPAGRVVFGRRAAVAGALVGLAAGGAALAAVEASGGSPGRGTGGGTRHVLNRLTELPPDRAVFVALDTAGGQAGAMTGLRSLRRATEAPGGPPEIGLALGATYFQSAGLLDRTPRQLVRMPAFPGDLLREEQCGGDVLIQAGGRNEDEAWAAARRLVAAVPRWTVRWRIDAFRGDNRMESGRALTRNRFGYTEGLGNPARAEEAAARALVRPHDGEPAWAVGGSCQVVRHIRFATRLWDQDSPQEQDRVIGRHRDGRWLDGTPADGNPDFAADPHGRLTPLASHVRLANPRTHRDSAPPLVRRSYSYVGSTNDNGDTGTTNEGLVFSCYQRSLNDGFLPVQRKLAAGAMNDYILTTGGGYYFVPPAEDAWLRRLFG